MIHYIIWNQSIVSYQSLIISTVGLMKITINLFMLVQYF